jgi:hypothetical protein
MDRPGLRLLSATLALIAVSNTLTQEPEQPKSKNVEDPDATVLRRLPNFFFTTESYKREALQMLIEEANRVANQLNLPETTITISNLAEVFIEPPASGAIGFVSTTNYAYMVGNGRKFSGLTQRNLGESFERVKAAYHWPISRLDTNAAFQVATQILSAVRMDVTALNRDCTLEVYAPRAEPVGGTHFIPDYWVTWRKAGELVAFIEFVQPTRSIRQFLVKDPKYILTERIRVRNLAVLLNQTNAAVSPSIRAP